MPYRRRRTLGLLTGLLTVALATPAAASASTVSISDQTAPVQYRSSALSVTVSGTADKDTSLHLYAEQSDGSGCAATANEQMKTNGRQADAGFQSVPAGSFSIPAKITAPAGTYIVCAYLVDFAGEGGASVAPPLAAATGGPISFDTDQDNDGVGDASDACPYQPAAGGCPPPPPAPPAPVKDTDSDTVPDDRDRCPTVPAEASGADPAHAGCPKQRLVVVLPASIELLQGTLKGGLKPHYRRVHAHGFETPKSVSITVTLSSASAKAAKIAKREVASTKVETTGAGPWTFTAPEPSAANRKKLKRLKTITVTYKFVATMATGEQRKMSRTFTLKSGKAGTVQHTVYGESGRGDF